MPNPEASRLGSSIESVLSPEFKVQSTYFAPSSDRVTALKERMVARIANDISSK